MISKRRKKELEEIAKVLRNNGSPNLAAVIVRGLKAGVSEAEINRRLNRVYTKQES